MPAALTEKSNRPRLSTGIHADDRRELPQGNDMYEPAFRRHKTREVRVGDKVVGGENPIWVQSMTTTNTYDVYATVAQINRLVETGCEIVRVTVPKGKDLAAVEEIKKRIGIPLICDIHFDYRMAIGCLDRGVDKIRINPGNIGGEERYKEV